MTTDTVTHLPRRMREPLRRKLNESIMVKWINDDLINRAGYDVRRSVVLYDEDGVFLTAGHSLPEPETLAELRAKTVVRYYSHGI